MPEFDHDGGGIQAYDEVRDAVAEDDFIATAERVAEAGRAACAAIQAAIDALEAGRRARLAGKPLNEIVDDLIADGGRDVRLSSADAFREYERAIAAMRGEVVRALVDEAGLSLTEVAGRLRISRQAAARLYQPAADGPDQM